MADIRARAASCRIVDIGVEVAPCLALMTSVTSLVSKWSTGLAPCVEIFKERERAKLLTNRFLCVKQSLNLKSGCCCR